MGPVSGWLKRPDPRSDGRPRHGAIAWARGSFIDYTGRRKEKRRLPPACLLNVPQASCKTSSESLLRRWIEPPDFGRYRRRKNR